MDSSMNFLKEWRCKISISIYVPLIKTFFPGFAFIPSIPVASVPSPNLSGGLQRRA